LFVFLGFVFVCFPDFPFVFPRVVASHDQPSPSISWASLGHPAPTSQSGILGKSSAVAWSRCRLSTPYNTTNVLKIQSHTQKPMTSGFSAEPHQSGHQLCSCSPQCPGSCGSAVRMALTDRC
jgi:hypothetical protein